MSNFQSLNAESLLTLDLSDIADLPGFEVPPVGYYKLSVSTDQKKIGENDSVVFNYEVLETMELVNKEEAPCVAGTKFSEAFNLANEFGVGNLKKSLAPYASAFGKTNVAQLLADIQGVQVFATIKHRKDKNDPTKIYGMVQNVTLA